MRRFVSFAVLFGIGLVPVASTTASATPATQSISGSLTNSSGGSAGIAGYSVALVTPNGLSRQTKVGSTGAFSFTVATRSLYGSTLEIIRPDGHFGGPVELAQDNLGTKSALALRTQKLNAAGHTQFAGVSTTLGKLRLVMGGASAIGARVVGPVKPASPATAKTWYRTSAVRAYLVGSQLGGAFPGAARLGLYRPVALTTAEKEVLTGAKAVLVPHTGVADPTLTGLGGDLDGDGIPNAIDVDDNGNLSLDAVDPNSSATAFANPWSDLRSSQAAGPFNAALTGVTIPQIASTIGGSGQFGEWFFIDEATLQRAAATTASIDWARIDCNTLVYCGAVLPGGRSATTNFQVSGEIASAFQSDYGSSTVNWADVHGGAYGCSDGSTGAFTRSDAGLSLSQQLNGLVLYCRGAQRFFNGRIQPQTGAYTLTDFSPGAIYTVTYHVHGAAGLSTMVMSLPPYGATVSGLTALNGGTVPSNGVVSPDGANAVTMEFVRPQRLGLPSEGVDFMDEGGLHYGVILGVEHSEYGCSPSRYSNLSGLSAGPDGASTDRNLWPLTDTNPVDQAVNPTNTLRFSVDLAGCFADLAARLGHTVTVNSDSYLTLTAAGEFLTGGANRSTLTFGMSIPTGGAFDSSVNVVP